MELGLVGKPNVGKSTLFSALTMAPAAVGNYPFTTVEPNRGMTYVRAPCPHVELGLPTCNPGNAPCRDGTRWVPVELIDVAGLVPGAHEGRGLGNKFLDDLRAAPVLIHVVDAAGATDAEGQPVPAGTRDPMEDVRFLTDELDLWIEGILERGWPSWAKSVDAGKSKIEDALQERVSGLGVTHGQATAALRHVGLLEIKPTFWSKDDLHHLGTQIRLASKPLLVAANKADLARDDALARLAREAGAEPVSAESELALRKAAAANLVRYNPGDPDFEIVGQPTPQQAKGLEYIREHVIQRFKGTGAQALVERAVYKELDRIVVFPVEDETHYKDQKDRVLPDAFLVPKGTTARQMAYKVHTDLGEHFIRAVDARTHRALAADHELNNGDVVRIVART